MAPVAPLTSLPEGASELYGLPPEVANEPGHRGRLDLGNPLCESLVAELAKRKTYVDPTLAVFRNMILLSDVPEVGDHP